ncbi:hypothetical protein K7711_37260 [Nocardia sp. CA2R105]|uniref:hypothetical protein n=1 Tax=Nocardia coffeae TaxID=2873381 RepID=UPI001CA69DC0|nr:hypothetical protein [Nocardia coffeae]MBY8862172.1 hypothetical protein [Nocardia coffeae]
MAVAKKPVECVNAAAPTNPASIVKVNGSRMSRFLNASVTPIPDRGIEGSAFLFEENGDCASCGPDEFLDAHECGGVVGAS